MKTIKCIIGVLFLASLISCEKEELTFGVNEAEMKNITFKGKKIAKGFGPKYRLESKSHKMGGFADHAMAIFKGEVWSVGGDNTGTPPFTPGSDIWSSTDGRNWSFVRNDAFPARANHSLLVYKKKLWVIGGTDSTGNVLNDIWNSSNGIDWQRVHRFTTIGEIGNNGSVVFKDRIYVFIGNGEVTTKVWSSNDGVHWRLETSNAFPVRNYTCAIVFKDYLYVAGGWDRDSGLYSDDVWASFDGVHWSKNIPGPSADPRQERIFSPRIEPTMTEYNGEVWVIGGIDQDHSASNEIWSTTNMKYWKKHGDLPKSAPLSHHASLLFKNRLWIFGGYHQSSNGSQLLSSYIWSMR